MTAWSVGVLQHVSSAELHFGMNDVDGKDLLFAINVHSARFEWPDTSEGRAQFFTTKPRGSFGKTLVIHLQFGPFITGRAAIAEFFPDTIDVK